MEFTVFVIVLAIMWVGMTIAICLSPDCKEEKCKNG